MLIVLEQCQPTRNSLYYWEKSGKLRTNGLKIYHSLFVQASQGICENLVLPVLMSHVEPVYCDPPIDPPILP